MYQILSDEGFADIIIAKLVGSDFGQKVTAACEMEQQVLTKMSLLADNVQKVDQQSANGSGSIKIAAQDSKNKSDNNQSEFDKLVQASLDRLKNYAQEQLKNVTAHKESISEGLKNIFKNVSTEIPGLLTALLGKKMLDLFDGWWPKLGKSIEEKLDKIFKIDKKKDTNQSPAADKNQPLTNAAAKNNVNGQQTTKSDSQIGNTNDNKPENDPKTAVDVFKKKMDERKTDYAKIMEESFNRINSSAEQHFNKMLTGAESFSQGFKGIFKDMTTEISKMLLQIFYKQSIEKPLGDWFSTMLGGIFGGTKTTTSNVAPSSSWSPLKQQITDKFFPTSFDHRAKGGPVSSGDLYRVGEEGEEWFVPSTSGNIISNHELRTMSKNSEQTPPVIVNIVNKSGVQANTKQETSWDGQQYVINVVMDAYARNVNGMRDVLGVRR